MKWKLVNPFKAQPRLGIAVLLGGLVWLITPGWQATRLLTAWSCSTGLYLALALAMMFRSNVEKIRSRAAAQDEGRMVILGLVTITALVSLAGVTLELARAKANPGQDGWRHVGLAAATVLLSWSFLHTVFAIHYAHEYYSGPEGGLEFPGREPPDYWDFMYYSFIIGTSCATADVDVSDRSIRKTTALHCIVSFFFNSTILALMVNVGAELF